MAVQCVAFRMALDRTVRDRDETAPPDRRFVVTCDDCAFEEEVHGVHDAETTAMDHKRTTDHEVVAVEFPRTS